MYAHLHTFVFIYQYMCLYITPGQFHRTSLVVGMTASFLTVIFSLLKQNLAFTGVFFYLLFVSFVMCIWNGTVWFMLCVSFSSRK